jgi:hypothetical protein
LSAQGATWAAYILGPVAVLVADAMLQESLRREEGVRIAVWSDVTLGAGISSSAALEVATLYALQGLYTPNLDEVGGMQLAMLAQRAEHRVALAPCGIMDRVMSTLDLNQHLLMVRCQPGEMVVGGEDPELPGGADDEDGGEQEEVADRRVGKAGECAREPANGCSSRVDGERAEIVGVLRPLRHGWLLIQWVSWSDYGHAPYQPSARPPPTRYADGRGHDR